MGEKSKMSRKVESDLLLNIKDIEKVQQSNIETKKKDKVKSLDSSLEKYNQAYVKAQEAPIPDIKLPFSEVLIRAVPFEVKTKSGLILNGNNLMMAGTLDRMSEAVSQYQEILLLGGAISEEDQEKSGIKVGRICKYSLKRFQSLSDEHQAGNIKKTYDVPCEEIDGYKYLIIDRRDIMFTKEKE